MKSFSDSYLSYNEFIKKFIWIYAKQYLKNKYKFYIVTSTNQAANERDCTNRGTCYGLGYFKKIFYVSEIMTGAK